MDNVFYGNTVPYDGIDIGSWDTSNVTTIGKYVLKTQHLIKI